MQRTPQCILVAVVAGWSLLGAGCATKKYVREAIAPVQNQTNEVQKQTQENRQAIGDLDRQVSIADEKAVEAGRRADAAGAAAQSANDAAGKAQHQADSATSLAQQAQNGVTSLSDSVQTKFQNLDNYKLIGTEQVHFKPGRSVLSKEDKALLDRVVQTASSQTNYVIEVEGFADRTGGKAYNLELTRRRAEAVCNYLVVQRGVPLRSIRRIGAGEDFPNAVNRTAADRQANRRADVKVYGLDLSGTVAQK